MKKVSVIVPIYNQEKEIESCVKSIQNQIYKNIEIILINDGSTDKSKQIIEGLKKTDDRISTYHQKNQGVSVARNIGIEKSKGAYLVFVDGDDLIAPTLVDTLLKVALKENVDIVACGALIKNGNRYERNNFFQKEGIVQKERIIAQLLTNNFFKDADPLMDIGVPWGKIYKKSFLIKNKIFFNIKLRRSEDNIFNLYAFHFANKIYYVKKNLYYYDYENFAESSSGYIKDIDDLNFNLAKETYFFIKKFYVQNRLLNQLCLSKITELLMGILNKKVYDPQYDISCKKRVETARQTCEQFPFKMIFDSNKNLEHLNIFYQIIFLLLKHKLYYTPYLLFIFKSKLTKVVRIFSKGKL